MIKRTKEDIRYLDEINLADEFYEFHPDAFDQLSAAERELLAVYYLLGREVQEDVLVYRAVVVRDDPAIADAARAVLRSVLARLGVEL